ncbi:MAG TPA: YciI family protein [Dehalococcoidia bacterium]|nr:YciI family protein [Dehalococcoidia bacterium]
MKYMFLLYNAESDAAPTPDEMAKWMEFGQYAGSVAGEVSGAALQPSATATTVSVREGKTVTTDGPFAEAKEMVGGYYVYDCADLDQAIDLASRIPWAPTGHIEVRPVIEFE